MCVSIVMCKRLPKVVVLTVHLCIRCDGTLRGQEMPLNADLLIDEGANGRGCQ